MVKITVDPNYMPPYVLSKSTIVRRLMASGQLTAALDLLEAQENRQLKALWDAIIQVESDHADTQMLRDLLGQIDGLDVDMVLGPET